MTGGKAVFQGNFDKRFFFESYGVRIKVESNSDELLAEAQSVARRALVGQFDMIGTDEPEPEFSFGLGSDGAKVCLIHNGEQILTDRPAEHCFPLFNSLIRLTVGEHAVSKVFVHAGVVGWRGSAIILPGKSFQGKSTLVEALIRNGAEYYSDEYAVLDENGLVHPFARDLSIRDSERGFLKSEVPIEEIGGVSGVEPIPVGLVLITDFQDGTVWNPEILTTGQGVIELVQHTFPMRFKAEFSLKVLKSVASRAIIAKSPRSDARAFAKILLSFFDNYLNELKIVQS